MEPQDQTMTVDRALDLALEHHSAGRLTVATQIYHQILAQIPEHVDAIHLLGRIATQTGQYEQARQLFQRAVALDPSGGVHHARLAWLLRAEGKLDQALATYSHAILLEPNDAEIQNDYGAALESIGRIDEAQVCYEKSILLNPQYALPRVNLAHLYQLAGRFDEAMNEFQHAQNLAPNDVLVRFNIGHLKLLRGLDLRSGLEMLEPFREQRRAAYTFTQNKPRWNREPLDGRRLLIHAEQGHGDTIQYARYLSQLRQFGGPILLTCQPDLARLLKQSFPEIEVIAHEEASLANMSFDLQAPLLRLPSILQGDSIPAAVPYLRAHPDDVKRWSDRLAGDGLKVGVIWSGNPALGTSGHRGARLAHLMPLKPLWSVPGVRFISLQKGDGAGQIREVVDQPLLDFTSELNDFADSAALIENLDLVIATDTSVPHLAGAMGKPVWLLTSFVPDWRWLLDRTDSPWYPTMRLFRQPTRGDWNTPIDQMTEALRQLAGSKP